MILMAKEDEHFTIPFEEEILEETLGRKKETLRSRNIPNQTS